jgi:hypothetical protein
MTNAAFTSTMFRNSSAKVFSPTNETKLYDKIGLIRLG